MAPQASLSSRSWEPFPSSAPVFALAPHLEQPVRHWPLSSALNASLLTTDECIACLSFCFSSSGWVCRELLSQIWFVYQDSPLICAICSQCSHQMLLCFVYYYPSSHCVNPPNSSRLTFVVSWMSWLRAVSSKPMEFRWIVGLDSRLDNFWSVLSADCWFLSGPDYHLSLATERWSGESFRRFSYQAHLSSDLGQESNSCPSRSGRSGSVRCFATQIQFIYHLFLAPAATAAALAAWSCPWQQIFFPSGSCRGRHLLTGYSQAITKFVEKQSFPYATYFPDLKSYFGRRCLHHPQIFHHWSDSSYWFCSCSQPKLISRPNENYWLYTKRCCLQFQYSNLQT